MENDINEQLKQYGANKKFVWKPEVGENEIRILTPYVVLATHFFGKGIAPVVCKGIEQGCPHHGEEVEGNENHNMGLKLVCYIIDRKDGKVQLAELPLGLNGQVNQWKVSKYYAFENFPMPYDILITSQPEQKDPKAKYLYTPSPKSEELTEAERFQLDEAMKKITPQGYVEKRKGYLKPSIPSMQTDYPEMGEENVADKF